MNETLSEQIRHSKAPAIARAVAVLRLLGRSASPLGLQAIAGELGLAPSTCLYVLRALVDEELVAFDPATKRYTLEAGILTLARGWLQRSSFATAAQPHLARLAREHGVTMMGVQVVGLDHIVVVGLALGDGNLQLSAEIGSRFPALISATGRCIAAHAGAATATLRQRFDALRWDDPPAFELWLEQVEAARGRGFATDSGNYIAGVAVVAAPLLNAAGRVGHALIAIGMSGAVRQAGEEALGKALVDAAGQIASRVAKA